MYPTLPYPTLTLPYPNPFIYVPILPQRRGKGAGGREERDVEDEGADAKPFRSGKKSKTVRK